MKKTSVLSLMRHSRSLVAGIFLSSGMALFGANAQAAATLNLAPGWNLLGNSSTATLDVAAMFGDPNKVTTVWKWDKSARSWAMYTPLMKHDELALFAKSKGFAVLTRIGPKEGFWVNSSASFALNGSDAPEAGLGEDDLTPGWNLVGDAQKIQPSQLSQNLKTALTASGKSIDAVWAWDMPTMKWRFYSPKLEAQSSTALADYINSKGYLPFSSAMTPADGFWVNVGPAAATTLAGMASVGSPIVAATVAVKGSAAEATTTTDASTGMYSLDAAKIATLGNPPYLIKVSGGTVSGAANTMTYYSVAQGAGMANVSPYTQLVTAA
ncbi:MAG TPA: hypothetical protein VJ001_10435, partial [Rhodocyclaceae bacterium]|nr:hypothetical protein [Rhodocyclaceae bacterium]